MRNLSFLFLAALLLGSCKGSSVDNTALQHERDSLQNIVLGQQEELDSFMATFSEIQDGLSQMAEAEGRVIRANDDRGRVNQLDQIREDMNYLTAAMQQQRERIAQLSDKLKESNLNVESMKKALANLQKQLDEQTRRVQELQIQLAEKDVIIESQNEQIARLGEEKEEQAQTIDEQDRQLNEAWYVFGTKSELKSQKIIDKGEVLSTGRFNKNYFTSIDIRTFSELKLYSKSAKLLTTHPAGSYTLTADKKGEYVLKITNAQKFWSVSKYLVVQVKG